MYITATPHPGGMLAALRSEAGMSQGALARAVGVSQGHLSRVEAGQRDLTPDLYKRAAAAVAAFLHETHGRSA